MSRKKVEEQGPTVDDPSPAVQLNSKETRVTFAEQPLVIESPPIVDNEVKSTADTPVDAPPPPGPYQPHRPAPKAPAKKARPVSVEPNKESPQISTKETHPKTTSLPAIRRQKSATVAVSHDQLLDSISSFSKMHLKRTVTDDRSQPATTRPRRRTTATSDSLEIGNALFSALNSRRAFIQPKSMQGDEPL